MILGRPGVGKTTLVKKIAVSFPGFFRGFYTEEIRERERLGFRVVTLSGKRGILAHVEGTSPFSVGRYKVFVSNFESVVCAELEKALEEKSPLLLDEVGKMELCSSWFTEWFRRAWSAASFVVVTSSFPPLPRVAQYWEEKGVEQFLLHPHNRAQVTEAVLALLRRAVPGCGGQFPQQW